MLFVPKCIGVKKKNIYIYIHYHSWNCSDFCIVGIVSIFLCLDLYRFFYVWICIDFRFVLYLSDSVAYVHYRCKFDKQKSVRAYAGCTSLPRNKLIGFVYSIYYCYPPNPMGIGPIHGRWKTRWIVLHSTPMIWTLALDLLSGIDLIRPNLSAPYPTNPLPLLFS